MNQRAPQPTPQPSEFLPGTVALLGAGPGDQAGIAGPRPDQHDGPRSIVVHA